MQITQMKNMCDIRYHIVQIVSPYSQATATYNLDMAVDVWIGKLLFVVFQKTSPICPK